MFYETLRIKISTVALVGCIAVRKGNKLFFGNLSANLDADLYIFFENFGEVVDLKIHVNKVDIGTNYADTLKSHISFVLNQLDSKTKELII